MLLERLFQVPQCRARSSIATCSLTIACCSRAGVQKPDRRSPSGEKVGKLKVSSALRAVISGPVSMRHRKNCGHFHELRHEYAANSLVVGLCGGEGGIRTPDT